MGLPQQVLRESELRNHLRVDDYEERDYLRTIAVAAREHAEHYTGVLFGEREVTFKLDEFQELNFLDYGVHPVNEVMSITYIDKDGQQQSQLDYYLAHSVKQGSRLMPVYGGAFPEVQSGYGSVEIKVKAGHTNIPEAVRAALKMIAANLYEHREDESTLRLQNVGLSSKALLNQYKVQVF